MTTLKVAIVGSGPAGCYVAERLGKKAKGAVEIDVFDRLPTPFGLVRSGVAPDHQSIKMSSRVMAKALEKPEVRFFGHVEIGRDLDLEDLRQAYDAVVIAIGAPEDRPLGVPGDDLPGVLGSGAFTRWYNDHPDAADRASELGALLGEARRAVVIGNGNVAVDVTRMLAKQSDEMQESDLSPDVTGHLHHAPIEEILMVGRRDAQQVKFTPAEIRELGELSGAAVKVDPADVPLAAEDTPHSQAYQVLKDLADAPREAPVSIRLAFCLQPEEVLAGDDGRVRAMRFRKTRMEGETAVATDETLDIPCDIVIPCIGYTTRACGDLPIEHGRLRNDDGKVADGLYVVGWAKRGPSGTIGTNRSEAHGIADRIMAEHPPAGRPGRQAVEARLGEAGARVVDWQGWVRIDAAETGRADSGRVRRKFTAIGEMLDAAEADGER